MKKTILIAIAVLTLSSCQRGCTKIERSFQTSERDYSIVMFSGGDTVFVDNFRGIVNNSEHSDGIYYYKNGELVEVSGDYVIKSK
jgi:hypothetical protein